MTKSFSKEAIILGVSSLLLILLHYFPIFPKAETYFLSVTFYLLIIPLAIAYLLGIDIRSFGFAFRKWPFSWNITIVGLVCIVVYQLVVGTLPQYDAYYASRIPTGTGNLILYITLAIGVHNFAWEFFFRGFLLFGLKERFGMYSIVIQSVPFALMHIGKPPIEAIVSVFAGLLFGYIAYRSESFIPVFLLHWVMGALLIAMLVLS